MPVRILKKEDDKKEDKKKKPKGSSKLDIFKSYGKYDGKPVELKTGGLTGGLTGGQVKLDKNKDGKISGEDFKMMGKKRGGATRKNPNSPKGQNPVSEYDRKGKLKYTAANQGGMMAKSTRGYGAARTSGMGLQDEKVKPGKVQKAALGAIALGIGLKKLMDKKGKGLPPGLGAAALISKKKKDILGKRSGGMMKYKKGGGADSGKVGEMKSKLSVGLMKANKIFSRSKPKRPKAPKQRTMTPLKKMGGGMMMKQYNKGGSVTASCKLGRNKATKLY
tara:strand:- start:469 stop:1299 length:831 start_codon:yes stop_codon:yes gene_type:complete